MKTARTAPKSIELAAAAKRGQQGVELATEMLALRKRELDREQLGQEVLRLTLEIQKIRSGRMSPLVVLTEKDYQEQIDEIKKNEEAASNALSVAQEASRNIEPQRLLAKQQLDAATDATRPLLNEKYHALRRTR